jgi:uncharacterized iron-regulated membrane protein
MKLEERLALYPLARSMYHRTRSLHRWIGFIASLFLAVISCTGFFLAMKGQFSFMRPPVQEATKLGSIEELLTVADVLEIAYAAGHPELSEISEVDRVDYRPKDNVFKVVSKEGYREIQVDGTKGKIVSNAFRNDQLMEDIHDMSFIGDVAHGYLLPIVAVGLLFLSISGIIIFLTPIVRRWRFKRGRLAK